MTLAWSAARTVRHALRQGGQPPVRQPDDRAAPDVAAQHARHALHRLAQHVAHGGEPECRPITGLWTWRWHTPCHDPLACHYWVFGHTRGICRSWVSTNRSPCREDGRPGVLVSHTVIPGGRWTTRGRRPGGPPRRRRIPEARGCASHRNRSHSCCVIAASACSRASSAAVRSV